MLLLSSADLSKLTFENYIFQKKNTKKNRNTIRVSNSLGPTICKGYQKTTKVAASNDTSNSRISTITLCILMDSSFWFYTINLG